MLACYYPQGKQLASGVIGLLTCQSHYNVCIINTTPCARLLLRHPLDQRIATLTSECALTVETSCVGITKSLGPVVTTRLRVLALLIPEGHAMGQGILISQDSRFPHSVNLALV